MRDEIFHLAREVDEGALACADGAAVVRHRELQRALDFDRTDLWGREGEERRRGEHMHARQVLDFDRTVEK